MQKVCADRYVEFWAAGQASKIKQISMEEYGRKYSKGELKQVAAVV
jgi:fructose-bisphosphate aldolase, class II